MMTQHGPWCGAADCGVDTLTRLHALTKADNLGLGLVVLGLLPHVSGPLAALKLICVWLLVLLAGRPEQAAPGGGDAPVLVANAFVDDLIARLVELFFLFLVIFLDRLEHLIVQRNLTGPMALVRPGMYRGGPFGEVHIVELQVR